MRFDLDDRKKIQLLCDLIRAVSGGKSNVVFVWHRSEGWAVLQNQEYLNNLEGSNLVNLCSIKPHFFSHVYPQNRDFLCFELDLSNLARVLKSTKNQIKRMVWHIFPQNPQSSNSGHKNKNNSNNSNSNSAPNNSNQAELQVNILMDEGQLEIRKEITLNTRMNAQSYFTLFREFKEEKTQYLEMQQSHLKQMKELQKNECVYFRFSDEFVAAYNHPDENNICIKKTVLEKYDYASLIRNLGGKNRLAIPPNFLVPQILIALKLRDCIQLFIGDEIIDDCISVSLRSKNDSFTFISQFKSVMEDDEEDTRQNPFDAIQQHQNRNAFYSNPSNAPYFQQIPVSAATAQQQQIQYQQQNLSLQSDATIESHIQGLTNQLYLADPYMNSHSLNSNNSPLEFDSFNQNQNNNNIFKKPISQQQQQQQQPQQQLQRKRVNITLEDERNLVQKYGNAIHTNQLNNSANNIYSLNSTQQSISNGQLPWTGGLPIKRKNEVDPAEFQNIPFFKDNMNKRIKEFNYSESHHRIPEQSSVQKQQLQHMQQQQQLHQSIQPIQQQQKLQGQKGGQPSSILNPFVSQQSENGFSSFLNENAKEDNFSIFKAKPQGGPFQFQQQQQQQLQQHSSFLQQSSFLQDPSNNNSRSTSRSSLSFLQQPKERTTLEQERY